MTATATSDKVEGNMISMALNEINQNLGWILNSRTGQDKTRRDRLKHKKT